ncbi:MAG: vanadium-dependent haloperoxidase [Pseudomonadota bacterium]
MERVRRALAVLGVLWAALATAADGTWVAAWNEQVLEVAEAEDGLLTLKGVRAAAMTHQAMARTLRCADTCADSLSAYAAAVAAHAVALHEYPAARSRWDCLLARARPADARAAALEPVGARARQVAQGVLRSRQDDGWSAPAEYRWRDPAPGVYAAFPEHSRTPADFVFGAGWARARPFALSSPQEFRVPPPPAIDSLAYAEAYEEVRRLGAQDARHRTADQTHLALWWKDFVERSHNRLARELIAQEEMDLREASQLLAWLNASIFDAYVASFDSKFHHNHWRPYTAIRWPDDGNPATVSDATWTNTHDHTYAFPSYPSAHGTACGAAMTVLAHVFGDDRRVVMRTPFVDGQGPGSSKRQMIPPTREFRGFLAAADQCGRSRVFLGIHFTYDATQGVALGHRVGRAVLERLVLGP